jgi:predicted acetyltransferase
MEPDEMPAVSDLLALGFGIGPVSPPEHRAEVNAVVEVDRTLVVEDEGRLVATAGAFTLHLALPGAAVPMAGVTEVVVAPTHRRRGLLTALIEGLHDQAVERGEPLAGLTASEGGIYRRFGYGVAARFQSVRVDARRSGEAPAPFGGTGTDRGRMRYVSEPEAATVLPAVWDRHWRRTPGELDRTPGLWADAALDGDHARAGASPRHVVVHDDAEGRPDGFAIYRIAQDFGVGGTNHEMRLLSLAAATDQVEATLLRFLLDIDLVGSLTWDAPVDLPLRWRLTDPRALLVTAQRDMLWLRPLDVAACLAARTYRTDGELTLEVVDERRDAGGRFLLAAGAQEAECRRTDRSPDLAVTVADLGSLLAGGTTWHTLQRAGRIDERAGGAVSRADDLFRPARAAYCATEF